MDTQSMKFTVHIFFNILLFICMTGQALADSSQTNNKIFTVGFAQDTMANDWRQAQVNKLTAEFEKYPNIKFIVTDAGGNSARQIQDIEDLAHQKVDVLITSPRNGAASTPAISRIYKQGIPIVLITRTITTDDYTTLVTPDDYQIAHDAAEFIAKKLSGKGKVLILRGVPTATTAMNRTRGFVDAIKQYPGIKVIAIKNGNYLRGDAIRATEEALLEKLQFDAIYAQSDSMASGARLALKKMGISPKSKLIVGIDYINEARNAIRSGEQSASFLYPTCAKQAANAVVKILHGKPVAKKITVKSQMITKDNVELVTPIF